MSATCQNKVAFVTGGAAGIGRASAVSLAREGARIMVSDIDLDGCEETVALIKAAGGEAMAYRLDVSNEAAVEAAVKQTVREFGSLDIAFNNAGISGSPGKTGEYETDVWNEVLAINLTGVWFCMKYELRQMQSQASGSIVNTASVAGLVGMSHAPAYCAAKHGVIGLTKNAALEYAKANIRVNAICPGGVHTNMTASADKAIPGFLDKLAKHEPMGRLADPAEIASSVVWLCSDGASFMTGHALAIDGGYTAR